jgi:hypothetical protein
MGVIRPANCVRVKRCEASAKIAKQKHQQTLKNTFNIGLGRICESTFQEERLKGEIAKSAIPPMVKPIIGRGTKKNFSST